MDGRITYSKNGEFGIEGIDLTRFPAKLYSAVAKLKDYENTGLSPDEVERLKCGGYGKARMRTIEDGGCVACGDYAPEGRQVCLNCERKEEEGG